MTTTTDAIVRNGPVLDTYRAFEKLPFGGRWLFSHAFCRKAPFFGSIRPRFDDLRPGFGRVRAPYVARSRTTSAPSTPLPAATSPRSRPERRWMPACPARTGGSPKA